MISVSVKAKSEPVSLETATYLALRYKEEGHVVSVRKYRDKLTSLYYMVAEKIIEVMED